MSWISLAATVSILFLVSRLLNLSGERVHSSVRSQFRWTMISVWICAIVAFVPLMVLRIPTIESWRMGFVGTGSEVPLFLDVGSLAWTVALLISATVLLLKAQRFVQRGQ